MKKVKFFQLKSTNPNAQNFKKELPTWKSRRLFNFWADKMNDAKNMAKR